MENSNKQYRYQLEHCTGNKKKLICPECGRRCFVPYIDTESGKIIDETVGRCDREINCGYHKTPKQFFEESGIHSDRRYWFPKKDLNARSAVTGFSTMREEIINDSMRDLVHNNFLIYLREHFPMMPVIEAINRYKIGTSRFWPGATVFWQIDAANRVRTGKIMLYDYHTGHRVKNPEAKIMWVHKLELFRDYRLQQCLFGSQLLRTENKPVAIVESEKTAIIASMFFDDALFLATGGITNLRKETCEPLKGRQTILFPDLGAEEIWIEKARTIPGLNNCVVSTWLQRTATAEEIANGLDIGDRLEKLSPSTKLKITDFL